QHDVLRLEITKDDGRPPLMQVGQRVTDLRGPGAYVLLGEARPPARGHLLCEGVSFNELQDQVMGAMLHDVIQDAADRSVRQGAEELCLALEPCSAFRLLGGCGASEKHCLDRTGTPIEPLISPQPDRTHVTGRTRRDESIPATHQSPRM